MNHSDPQNNTDELNAVVADLVDTIGVRANKDQVAELLRTAIGLGTDNADRLDLKIANAALREMREGFEVFAPYRDQRKITMFGSARIKREDPLYEQAKELAGILAAADWSTVTGAGPGIMAAGLEGAGVEHSFGINIRLPFEQYANQFIMSDPKLVSMKYFFTRKLLLVKESSGYVVCPGGFGTLDEAFELLTLLQTGKAEPAPVVLLDTPGNTYWSTWEKFVSDEVVARGLVGHTDSSLYLITDSVTEAANEIIGFYRNYHSLRWVDDELIVRMKLAPTEDHLVELSESFSDITREPMRLLDAPTFTERRNHDHLDLARIALRFDRVSYARLRELINALNAIPNLD